MGKQCLTSMFSFLLFVCFIFSVSFLFFFVPFILSFFFPLLFLSLPFFQFLCGGSHWRTLELASFLDDLFLTFFELLFLPFFPLNFSSVSSIFFFLLSGHGCYGSTLEAYHSPPWFICSKLFSLHLCKTKLQQKIVKILE